MDNNTDVQADVAYITGLLVDGTTAKTAKTEIMRFETEKGRLYASDVATQAAQRAIGMIMDLANLDQVPGAMRELSAFVFTARRLALNIHP